MGLGVETAREELLQSTQPSATVGPSATVRNRPQPSAAVRNRPQPFAVRRPACAIWGSWRKRVFDGSASAVFIGPVRELYLLKLNVSFRCAGAVFWKAACSRCRASRICDPWVVALWCPAWQARDIVCAGAVFVGPVGQSARFGGPETCQNLSKSFWRHSPVLVLDACRKRVKVGVRGRSRIWDNFEFVASLLCVTGAAVSSVLVESRGRRGTLELFVQILWQAQYFGAWV